MWISEQICEKEKVACIHDQEKLTEISDKCQVNLHMSDSLHPRSATCVWSFVT